MNLFVGLICLVFMIRGINTMKLIGPKAKRIIYVDEKAEAIHTCMNFLVAAVGLALVATNLIQGAP